MPVAIQFFSVFEFVKKCSLMTFLKCKGICIHLQQYMYIIHEKLIQPCGIYGSRESVSLTRGIEK